LLRESFAVSDLTFLIPLALEKIAALVVFVIPRPFLPNYSTEMYMFFVLNAGYSNNVIYGKSAILSSSCFIIRILSSNFLTSLYPDDNMDLYCTLSTIPDYLLMLPACLIILEFSRLKRLALANSNKAEKPLSWAELRNIILKVIRNVILTPLIWSVILGVIICFSGSFFILFWSSCIQTFHHLLSRFHSNVDIHLPLFITQTTNVLANATYASSMFTVGLFLFVPVVSLLLSHAHIFIHRAHGDGLKINWKSVRHWISQRFSGSDTKDAVYSLALPPSKAPSPDNKKMPPPLPAPSLPYEPPAFSVAPSPTSSSPSITTPSSRPPASSLSSLAPPLSLQPDSPTSTSLVDLLHPSDTTSPEPAPPPAGAPPASSDPISNSVPPVFVAEVGPGSSAGPETVSRPPDYLQHKPEASLEIFSSSLQQRLFLVIFSVVIRFVIAPTIMLGLCALFTIGSNQIIKPILFHAGHLITALPVAVVAFSLSKEYAYFCAEAVLAIIVQSFIFTLPFFVLWTLITQAAFPV
jgi:hypothetical protein